MNGERTAMTAARTQRRAASEFACCSITCRQNVVPIREHSARWKSCSWHCLSRGASGSPLFLASLGPSLRVEPAYGSSSRNIPHANSVNANDRESIASRTWRDHSTTSVLGATEGTTSSMERRLTGNRGAGARDSGNLFMTTSVSHVKEVTFKRSMKSADRVPQPLVSARGAQRTSRDAHGTQLPSFFARFGTVRLFVFKTSLYRCSMRPANSSKLKFRPCAIR